MEEPLWKQRLRACVTNDDRGMKAISLAAGQGETFVRDILERERIPSIEKFIALAETLGTSVSELIAEEEPTDQSKLIQVPLLSWVSAGELVDAESQIPIADVPLLAFADQLGSGEYFALRVNGDSMDRLSPDGSVIVVNRADRDLVQDRCYVFSRRGEATYKRWQPDPPHLAPYSTNPSHKPVFIKGRKDFEIIGRVRRTLLDL